MEDAKKSPTRGPSPVHSAALFGELLLRLDPPGYQRLVQADQLRVSFTGGEANAGAVLAACGVTPYLISAVPAHEMGQACVQWMQRFGLDARHVQRRGHRLGILYVETGASQRPSKVIYDRTGSSFSQLRPGDVDWEGALQGRSWLHFTGTAPALSADLAHLTLEGCQAARRMGVRVSCDLNYRSTLWTLAEASAVMPEIVRHVDLLIANEEHASLILGAPQRGDAQSADPLDPRRYDGLFDFLRERYGLQQAALTLRGGASMDETRFAALLDDGEQRRMSRIYDIRVVDRIGAGDAFAGGLIHGLLSDWDAQRAVEFAAAAGCWSHTIVGDFCHASAEEIGALAESGGDGRIRR